MLISYKWLSTYFKDPLPTPRELGDIITMYAYTVDRVYEEGDDTILDIDVLPNRAPDSLSHRGVAREVAVLLERELVPPKRFLPEKFAHEERVGVRIEDLRECGRYVGRIVSGITIGPSPDWLVKLLASVGQKSINNIVDVTNYILLDMGQPMHAFDMDKIAGGEISVQFAKEGGRITTLDGKDVPLTSSMLVIADTEGPLAIAGVKGGKKAEITPETKTIVLEAANFNPISVRRAARGTGILTDSSKRFENGITPELAGYAMDEATALIYEIFPNAQVSQVTDEYLWRPNPYMTGISTAEVNEILGGVFTDDDVEKALVRVGCHVRFEKKPASHTNAIAKQLVGAVYKKGASIQYEAPRMFDCSSFVAYLFSRAGVSIPRMTVDQYMYGEEISEQDLSPGDIVFANTKEGEIHNEAKEFFPGKKVSSGVDHCGLYLGGGKVIHATHFGKGEVIIEELTESSMFANIVGYRRIPEAQSPRFVVTIPHERLDLKGSVSLAEEVGRIIGYEKLPALSLPKFAASLVNKDIYYAQALRKALQEEGYSEVMTYAFANKGETETANPIAEDKGFLRPNLSDGITKSLEMNARNLDLLGEDRVRIFEVGTVFKSSGEYKAFCIGVSHPKGYKENASDEIVRVLGVLEKKYGFVFAGEPKGDKQSAVYEVKFDDVIVSSPEPSEYADIFDNEKTEAPAYKKISQFPFITRDIAFWATSSVKESDAREILQENAGPLLARSPRLFDVFEKKDEGKISYAFRLVFQSHEKTLTDEEVNKHMETVTRAVEAKGWTVR